MVEYKNDGQERILQKYLKDNYGTMNEYWIGNWFVLASDKRAAEDGNI